MALVSAQLVILSEQMNYFHQLDLFGKDSLNQERLVAHSGQSSQLAFDPNDRNAQFLSTVERSARSFKRQEIL